MISGIEPTAKWIWAADQDNGVVYCRLNLQQIRSVGWINFSSTSQTH